jgi:hypothetical protein
LFHLSFSFGQIAQSVEQRTENPCVAGSIPVLATLLLPEKLRKSNRAHHALDQAIEKGADPNGTLVIWGTFGSKHGFFDDYVSLIPSKSKRYLAGAAGALAFFCSHYFRHRSINETYS